MWAVKLNFLWIYFVALKSKREAPCSVKANTENNYKSVFALGGNFSLFSLLFRAHLTIYLQFHILCQCDWRSDISDSYFLVVKRMQMSRTWNFQYEIAIITHLNLNSHRVMCYYVAKQKQNVRWRIWKEIKKKKFFLSCNGTGSKSQTDQKKFNDFSRKEFFLLLLLRDIFLLFLVLCDSTLKN